MSTSRSVIHPIMAAIKARQLTPKELVRESLRRIERSNGQLNAVVMLRAEAAIAEADRVDPDLPLAGLPFLVKDSMPVAGMRNTFGGFPPLADAALDQKDDAIVAKLRRAGAIVVGRSNAPSFGHIGVTVNPLYGATRNPWNLEAFEIIYDCELAERLLPWREQWCDFEPSLRMCLEHGISTPLAHYIAAQRTRFEVGAILEELLGPDGVLITPVKNSDGAALITAHGGTDQIDPGVDALKAEISGAGNTMDFNMAGLPALSVPMGQDTDGVPMGLQIAAPRFRDGVAFWLAERIEEARQWPQTAPGYTPFRL